jgi:hypothetical protein
LIFNVPLFFFCLYRIIIFICAIKKKLFLHSSDFFDFLILIIAHVVAVLFLIGGAVAVACLLVLVVWRTSVDVVIAITTAAVLTRLKVVVVVEATSLILASTTEASRSIKVALVVLIAWGKVIASPVELISWYETGLSWSEATTTTTTALLIAIHGVALWTRVRKVVVSVTPAHIVVEVVARLLLVLVVVLWRASVEASLKVRVGVLRAIVLVVVVVRASEATLLLLLLLSTTTIRSRPALLAVLFMLRAVSGGATLATTIVLSAWTERRATTACAETSATLVRRVLGADDGRALRPRHIRRLVALLALDNVELELLVLAHAALRLVRVVLDNRAAVNEHVLVGVVPTLIETYKKKNIEQNREKKKLNPYLVTNP